jgi:triphosphatase
MTAADTDETPIECEIKLAGSKGALRSAEAVIRRFVGGNVSWQTDALLSVYYDTVDRRLAQRGATLRVRRKNRTYTQTVKAAAEGPEGALANRPEWNVDIAGAPPDPALLPSAARTRLGLVLPGELKRLFAVDVSRKRANLILDGGPDIGIAEVEVAVDRGTVKAGRATDVISEVEIELVRGNSSAIYDLATALAACGLRVSNLTKAQRGYQLLDGPGAPAQPVRAQKFILTPSMTVSGALGEIFQAGLANVLANEVPAVSGIDPEGVHQMRVSLRRMRSALAVFKSMIDASGCQVLNDEFKWLADSLGAARDWDVFVDEILGPVCGVGIDMEGLALLRQRAEAERTAGYGESAAAIGSVRYTKLVIGLAKFIDTHAWMPAAEADAALLRAPVDAVAGKILSAAYKKVRKKARGLRDMDVADRHRVRIALKKFRYTSEFLQALYPDADVRRFNKALARMQDQFGHLNDVSVAENLLAHLVAVKGGTPAERRRAATAAGQVMGWHARGLHDLEDKLLADWKALKSAPVFWGQA